MPAILDLRVQLADRVKRSKALIEFINANGLLGKVRLRGAPRSVVHLDPRAELYALGHSCRNKRVSS